MSDVHRLIDSYDGSAQEKVLLVSVGASVAPMMGFASRAWADHANPVMSTVRQGHRNSRISLGVSVLSSYGYGLCSVLLWS